MLGPVVRTAGGRRRFSSRQRDLVAVYRALVPGVGVASAREIVTAIVDGRSRDVPARLDLEHARLHEARGRLAQLRSALDELAADRLPPRGGPTVRMTIGDLAAALGVRASTLRLWEEAGLVRPDRDPRSGHRRFDERAVRDARAVQILREGGALYRDIHPVLEVVRTRGTSSELIAGIDRQAARVEAASRALLVASAALAGLVESDPHEPRTR
jgi:DNA-binding transcriptional MerR regulator